jgi:4-hydroxybenzoate polyprenyltransferase
MTRSTEASAPAGEASARPPISLARRWWIYQRERFPVFAHGPLIAAFSFAAVSLSRTLRGQPGWPNWRQLLVAFATCFTFFLQLRIADEFKDFEEDARYRPYRPVQRGLVTLRQLGILFACGAIVQLSLAIWLYPKLIILLAITWVYLAAMSKEFFVGAWLRQRHILYMVSHMVIMPLVDLYATSTDWFTAGGKAPRGLIWFLLASYFNGLAIEIGRKIRSPQDEEEGVNTYSRLWGRSKAVTSWWGVMALTFLFAAMAAARMGVVWQVGSILLAAFAAAVVVGVCFLRQPKAGRGKWIEQLSGVWTLALYLSLGFAPHLFGRGPI